MTINGGRLVFRVGAQCLGSRQRAVTFSSVERTLALNALRLSGIGAACGLRSRYPTPPITRSYADKPISRPKAHTGRTSATQRRAPTTSATKAAKKPAPTKTAPKKIPRVKSAAKPRAAPRSKPKKKTKATKKSPKKKILTDKQQAARNVKRQRDAVKVLKERALLKKAPKSSASTAWRVMINDALKDSRGKKDKKFADVVKETAARYKNLEPEQLEHYNHTANQNAAADKVAYRQWVESYSPAQILDANKARGTLSRLNRKDTKSFPRIKDERLVQRSRTGYLFFYVSRIESGDFKGLKATEASKLAGREWKALSTTEKQPFLDRAAQDRQRFLTESATVYKDGK